jgi:hypothetical protein
LFFIFFSYAAKSRRRNWTLRNFYETTRNKNFKRIYNLINGAKLWYQNDANPVITWSHNPHAKTPIPGKPSKSGLIGVWHKDNLYPGTTTIGNRKPPPNEFWFTNTSMIKEDKTNQQKKNIFHTRCYVQKNMCSFIEVVLMYVNHPC